MATTYRSFLANLAWWDAYAYFRDRDIETPHPTLFNQDAVSYLRKRG